MGAGFAPAGSEARVILQAQSLFIHYNEALAGSPRLTLTHPYSRNKSFNTTQQTGVSKRSKTKRENHQKGSLF
jgi:hypothetical protein